MSYRELTSILYIECVDVFSPRHNKLGDETHHIWVDLHRSRPRLLLRPCSGHVHRRRARAARSALHTARSPALRRRGRGPASSGDPAGRGELASRGSGWRSLRSAPRSLPAHRSGPRSLRRRHRTYSAIAAILNRYLSIFKQLFLNFITEYKYNTKHWQYSLVQVQ